MKKIIIDGNEAAIRASYKLSENAFVYPITPSSAMAENFEKWSSKDEKNIFGHSVEVTEMQSEGGAIGALHGSILAGGLTTTFTSSQGLLLMIPNMYKIAGEMLPTVINVASRSVASHALNIFCDHSDVMSARQTGFAFLASSNPQETYDFALASHLTTLETNIPFLHFFDGFRTSHQLSDVNIFDDEDLKKIYPFDKLQEFKSNSLSPNNPYQYGTNENSDIFFQGRERSNQNYQNLPQILENCFEKMSKLGAKHHHIMEYYGSKNAKYVVCVMASAFDTIKYYLDFAKDNELGVVKINLYRPFDTEYFNKILPKSVKKIAVLDRTKEQGSLGEPLYLDICASVAESNKNIKVIGGRFGLGGKEFAPKHAKAVFDNLKNSNSKNHFSVGIDDDITKTSLKIDENFEIFDNSIDIIICGLGSDGSISASKNITKIIGENSNKFVQAYFMYDSKKSGGLTRSYLTISKEHLNKPFVPNQNDIVMINNASFLHKYNFAKNLKSNGTFIINSDIQTSKDFDEIMPDELKKTLAEKNAKIYSIDANKIAKEFDIDGKISMIMQTAFFEISNAIDTQIAVQKTNESIEKIFAKKGENVIKNNKNAIKNMQNSIKIIQIDKKWLNLKDKIEQNSNSYFDNYINPILRLDGDNLPVSKINLFGKNLVGTTDLEKRNITEILPKWIPEKCIQCGKCSFVCPHAVIRSKLIQKDFLKSAPKSVLTKEYKLQNDCLFSIQISPEDCTGCTLCSKACPTGALQMTNKTEVFDQEKESYNYLKNIENTIPNIPNSVIKTQFMKPYFEYSGACAGCGETPYIRLLSQLFGNSLIMANATGCSSIYGGSAPTCPYTKDFNNQGVAWANSLFEDNAEFGFGMLKSKKLQRENLKENIIDNLDKFDENMQILMKNWLENYKNTEICNQIYLELKSKQNKLQNENNKFIFDQIDNITKKSVWLVGGDGWAYDIDFGGIDHILSTGENVKILILDTEVYSNTGGQASKSTPKNAITTLSNSGKKTEKKRLALDAISYNNVYVAQVCLGADNNQTLNAFLEAEKFDGPSVIIAYAPCINHGIDMKNNIENQKKAVESGYWSLFRFNPDNIKVGKNPMQIDSKITSDETEYMLSQRRFANLYENNDNAQKLLNETKNDNWEFYSKLEKIKKMFEN